MLTCAGLTGEGLDEVWATLVEHQERMKETGAFDERRRAQQVRWTWQLVRDGLEHQLRAHPGVRAAAPELEKAVLAGELTPALAARQILDTFLAAPPTPRSPSPDLRDHGAVTTGSGTSWFQRHDRRRPQPRTVSTDRSAWSPRARRR